MIGASHNGRETSGPIRDEKDIARIRTLLADRPRDRLLFETTIQTGMPIRRLLGLRVTDLSGLETNQALVIRDDRGREIGVLVMTDSLQQAWREYLNRLAPEANEYIFRSTRSASPLSLSTVTNMVNGWFETLGLSDLRGIRSLRKTYELHYAGLAAPELEKERQAPETSGEIKGLKPVQMVSASEVVYQSLLETIVSGGIPPGERLVLKNIAGQMNVSRMPVREALQRLRAAGFVSVQGRGSMVVNELSRKDLEEIQHIRLILERDIVHKAVPNCTPKDIKELETIHHESSKVLQSGQRDLAVKYNKEFHMTIYRMAGMPIMAQMIESLLDRIGPYLHIELQQVKQRYDHVQSTIENHGRMLEALHARDADKLFFWLAKDHGLTTDRILSIIEAR